MQTTNINKVRTFIFYQLTMSLLVIDFTYLEGRNGDIVIKELAAVDFQSNSVASYVFKRPYGWEEIPMFSAQINEAIDHGCNWNDGDVLYSELETVIHREALSAYTIYCFGPQKTKHEMQWFILVTFKGDIPKNEVHELGDLQHTLSVYCGRYIRITSENTQVLLSKKDWSQLLDLASACIDREVIKYGRLQEELAEWRDKCFKPKSFCTPPDINTIHFDTLWNELKYKNMSLSDDK